MKRIRFVAPAVIASVLAISSCEKAGTGTGTGGSQDGQDNPEVPETAIYISSQEEFDALDGTGGGEIIFRDGTYNDMSLSFSAAASEENPLIIRAETPGGVIFTGTSHMEISGSNVTIQGFSWKDPKYSGEYLVLFRTGSEHCGMSLCTIDGSGNSIDAESKTKWVNLYGTGHVVEKCSFTNKKNMGALLVVWLEEGTEAGHMIRNNMFSRPDTILDQEGEPANEQETIRIGDSSHSMQEAGCIISGNYFFRCNGEKQEIVSNKSCGNTYSGNLFEESMGTLTLRHGNGCTVEDNIFIGNGIEDTGGIRIIGEDHIVRGNYLEGLNSVGYKAALCVVRGQADPELSGYFQVKDAEISDNTFVDCNLAMHLNYGSSSMTEPCIGVRITGNTIVCRNDDGTMDTSVYAVRYENTPGWSADSEDGPSQADISFEDNLFFGKFKNNYFGLASEKTCPEVVRPDGRIASIRSEAGAGR